jgi:hypothetical protein
MRAGWMLLVVALGGPALAQQSDEAALALADRPQAEAAAPHACAEYAEGAVSDTSYSDGRPSSGGGRTSFAIRCDAALNNEWRAVLSDRFDDFFARGASAEALNTLKEAYLSFRDGGTEIVDFGRINVREGVGFAYNPTDYFRADAVRARISIDPDTLRDERMGTLMARSQTLWSSGSLTAIVAPKVDAGPNDSTLNPDFGATNGRSRWLLVASQRLSQDLEPQVSLTAADHQSPQAGFDLTYLVNHAMVAYLEWSGGRSASNLHASKYPAAAVDTGFHSRLSTGFTYSTASKLSVTLEYEYDGAAPNAPGWTALRDGPIPPYVQYRLYAAAQGELATRQGWFGYAHWDDAGITHLGLTAFVRFDPYDRSRVTWAEARYQGSHAGIAVQWQRNAGGATSDLAPWPIRQAWLALIDYYF